MTTIAADHGKTGLTDEALLAQVRLAGMLGEEARALLLQRYYRVIVTRCQQVLRNDADARDAAQEAALKVYANLARFEGRSALKTWISTIATRECYSLLRKRQQQVQVEHVEDLIALQEGYLLASGESGDEAAEERVDAALDQLVPNAREVIQLRYYRDLSLEDVSRMLGVSLSAAKMRLYRALEQFTAAYG